VLGPRSVVAGRSAIGQAVAAAVYSNNPLNPGLWEKRKPQDPEGLGAVD
jgi:hypothetical protein